MRKTAIFIIIFMMLALSGCTGIGTSGISENPATATAKQPPSSDDTTDSYQKPEDTKAPATSSPSRPESPWSKGKDMPTARYALRSAALDGILYVFGGENGEYLSTVEAYDPVADSWTGKSDLPVTTGCIGAAALNGKIYVFMQGDSYEKNGQVFEYDPSKDSWTRKTEMTSNRCNLAITVYSGKIYVIGGLTVTDADGHFENVSTVESYNPETETWEKKADMPTPRHALSVSEYDGKLYAIAGSWTKGGTDVPCRLLDVYDPETDTWTSKSKLPYDTAYHCTVTLGDKIYLTGGVMPGYLYVYDPASDTWSYLCKREIRSWQNCMALIGKKIYVLGGTLGPNDDWVAISSLEIYDSALE